MGPLKADLILPGWPLSCKHIHVPLLHTVWSENSWVHLFFKGKSYKITMEEEEKRDDIKIYWMLGSSRVTLYYFPPQGQNFPWLLFRKQMYSFFPFPKHLDARVGNTQHLILVQQVFDQVAIKECNLS